MDIDILDSQVELIDVLVTATFLVIITLISVAVYKSMERPRLLLTATSSGPRALRADVIKYVLSAPVLVFCWYSFFTIILFLAPGTPSASTLLVMPLAIVVAIRFLAHVDFSGAYQLSSVIPMVVIASILTGGGLPDDQELNRVFSEIDQTGVTWTAFVAVFVLEYLFTTLWYWLRARPNRGSVTPPLADPDSPASSLGATSDYQSQAPPQDPEPPPSRRLFR